MEFGFEDLVGQVEREGGGPLAQLHRAASKSKEVSAMADALLDVFVQRGREAGLTWTQIGEALDISKQAAQQRSMRVLKNLGRSKAAEIVRSVTSRPMFGRFTDKARRAVVEAQTVAGELNHVDVGPGHLLVGLYRIGGVGAQALRDLGLSEEAVTSAVADAAGPDATAGAKPGFSSLARKTLERSLQEALKMGHNYIGTEHLALALAGVDQGPTKELLAAAGVDPEGLRARIVAILEERRGGGRPEGEAGRL